MAKHKSIGRIVYNRVRHELSKYSHNYNKIVILNSFEYSIAMKITIYLFCERLKKDNIYDKLLNMFNSRFGGYRKLEDLLFERKYSDMAEIIISACGSLLSKKQQFEIRKHKNDFMLEMASMKHLNNIC